LSESEAGHAKTILSPSATGRDVNGRWGPERIPDTGSGQETINLLRSVHSGGTDEWLRISLVLAHELGDLDRMRQLRES
jgi:hypothetical protein